jgi:murein tripeptide amidase MpaA
MVRRISALAAGLFVCVAAAEEPVRYDGHQLVNVTLNSPDELNQMLEISHDHWSCHESLGTVPFRVAPEQMDALKASGLPFEVVHENVQLLLDIEQAELGGRGAWFDTFHTYAEVNAYMDTLVAVRPDLALRFTLGQSLQGNNINGLQITGAGGTAGKPALLFNGCQHAREWVAVMVPMYVADRLIREYATNTAIQQLLDRAVVYVVPIVNPDGYLYSWSTDRLWRKNRRNNGNGNFGVDNNRNWGYQWGLDSGSSSNPASETYRGTAPFSEPETQVMRNFFQAHPEIQVHIDFHSYSQLILSPFGYAELEPAEPDRSTFNTLNTQMQSAIFAVHGENYVAGPIGSTLYLASGGAVDWAYGDQGALSWTIELRPATADPGFVLPASEIRPTCEENFDAVMVLGNYVTTPFVFEFPTPLPGTVPAATATTVDLNIRPVGGAVQAGSQRLYSRIGNAGAFASSPLASLGGIAYRATLPAAPCGSTIQFYFEAQSTTGDTRRSPAAAPTTVNSAQAVVTNVIFSDSMETNLGWTVGYTGDNATAGIWNRMNPQATAAQPEDDHTAAGTICWVTDGNAGGSVGANDVDNGRTTLVSPAIAVPAGNATIGYWRWYSNNQGSAPNQDVFRVDISTNGTTWINAETVGPSGPQAGGGWFYHEFAAATFVTLPANVRVRFVADDANPGSIVEAAVDDFSVIEAGCPPPPTCPGDVNDDGTRDLADLAILLGAFGASTGDPSYIPGADFDNNGTIDLSDLSMLLGVFGQPC